MKNALLTCLCVCFSTLNLLGECIFNTPIQIKEIQVGNLVKWSTLSEAGNEKFIVERSVDGVSFDAIGEVDGSIDSDEVVDYAFLDLRTGVSHAYYRLRMISRNAFESLTHTVFYDRENTNDYMFTSMSSPTTAKHFTLSLDSYSEGEMKYWVVNQKKKILIEKSRPIEIGANMISLNIEDIPIGTYTLKTELNDEVEEVTIRKVNPENQPKIQYVIK